MPYQYVIVETILINTHEASYATAWFSRFQQLSGLYQQGRKPSIACCRVIQDPDPGPVLIIQDSWITWCKQTA